MCQASVFQSLHNVKTEIDSISLHYRKKKKSKFPEEALVPLMSHRDSEAAAAAAAAGRSQDGGAQLSIVTFHPFWRY